MAFTPVSRQWPARRAVLLVHGIGNTPAGGGAEIEEAVRKALGAGAADTAFYQLYYDGINDWFAEKTQAAALVNRLMGAISTRLAGGDTSGTVAEYGGDVIWPVLSASARMAVREAYLVQLKQIVQDGVTAGVPARRQQLTIICHSMGCFHTYEALHAAAHEPQHRLRPTADEVKFANVVFMASPVKLIRSVAGDLGNAVPDRGNLATLSPNDLSIPADAAPDGVLVPSVRRWVSITGNLDPVGGHLFKRMLDWAYMAVPGQVSYIDEQSALNINSLAELVAALKESLSTNAPPDVTINDPHSWTAYVQRHEEDLRTWIVT